jgi:hypothetical protein
MVPSTFVRLDALPLGPNGKVDRKLLLAARPSRAAETPPKLPGTNLEKAVGEVWGEVLGTEVGGIDDNFFDAGGNSLALGRVAGKLRLRLGLQVAVVELIRFPTIRTLAAQLATQSVGETAPGVDPGGGLDEAARRRESVRRRREIKQRHRMEPSL